MTHHESPRILVAAGEDAPGRDDVAPPSRRSPGRPSLYTPEAVLEHIRALASRDDGLFRVHHRHSALYARARRMFGSWGAAVAAAGLDYRSALIVARRRSRSSRRQRGGRGRGAT